METRLYVRVEWEQECSQWTLGANWLPGAEYWVTQGHYWVPLEIADDEAAIATYILEHYD